ncbi:protein of unknown function [Micromonospora phaseoli]|uniref:DUF397 domain-containing protein n=1 Tax=Micromonospora phaseoli TaxID=1144548 RepID=A0A1H6WKY3_9ACTN|nr:DUF397 domain-containing protein [Micromonospora phaseoli]PZW01815.1 uncharacterized protein DUF397 [Micromonospora phaseoli]GIJ78199.1 hypothetical protein Xph01_26310 [Micromonospora phaseoli]SEJ16396.1 protein of unknown function [Micromonospora phaseoli]
MSFDARAAAAASGGDCVEAADNLPDVVAVRDSKDPCGPAFAVTPARWSAFLGELRRTRH